MERKWIDKDEYVKKNYPENYKTYLSNKNKRAKYKSYKTKQRNSYFDDPAEYPFFDPH